jgi:uncharacterized membrane protein YoaK (UPF0700 family)
VEPQRQKAYLLLTIVVSFVVGGAGGAVLVMHIGQSALLVPTLLLLLGAVSTVRLRGDLGLSR